MKHDTRDIRASPRNLERNYQRVMSVISPNLLRVILDLTNAMDSEAWRCKNA